MKWVRWSQWENNTQIAMGQMPMKNIKANVLKFKEEAKRVLNNTGADHVLYCVKLFDEDDCLEEVKFYMLPMTDDEFHYQVACRSGIMVYAVHA